MASGSSDAPDVMGKISVVALAAPNWVEANFVVGTFELTVHVVESVAPIKATDALASAAFVVNCSEPMEEYFCT